MTGSAVVTTRLSSEAMNRAMPVMTTAQKARDLVRRRLPSRSSVIGRCAPCSARASVSARLVRARPRLVCD